jgi:hypothetical protein
MSMSKRATVENEHGCFIVNGRMVYTDYDCVAAAESIGWSIRRVQRTREGVRNLARIGKACRHDGTDGTVGCKDCGVTVSDFIAGATDYLDARI